MGRIWLPKAPLKVILGMTGVVDLDWLSHLLGGDGVVVGLLGDGIPVEEVCSHPVKSWMACCASQSATCCSISIRCRSSTTTLRHDVEATRLRCESVRDDPALAVVGSLELRQCFVLVSLIGVKPTFQVCSYLSR